MSAHEGPLDQFAVSPIFRLPHVFGIDATITNSALEMLVAVFVVASFFFIAMRKKALVPGRMQSMAEVLYEFVQTIITDNAGKNGLKYFPFIFTLFLFILGVNLLGLVPMSFTPTSHIIITLGMGATVFIGITIIGMIKQGPVGFLKHFIPEGLPFWLIPVIFLIELVSYLARPISLGLRLAANMIAGHTLIHVVAGFVVPLGLFGVLPIAFLVFMNGLELFVCILQAYVFALLTSMYLSEAIADHHH